MFEEFSSVFTTNNDVETLPELLNTKIFQYLTALKDEYECYFPELNGDKMNLVRNPFRLQLKKFQMKITINFWSFDSLPNKKVINYFK